MSTSQLERNKSSYQYCESIQEQFNKICEPLANLDITYFGYMRFFSNGSFFYTSTQMDFQRDYLFKDGGGFGDIYSEVYSDITDNKYFLHPYDDFSIKKDRIISLTVTHNMWDILNVYKNINGCLHGYFFGTSTPESMFSQLYMNNIPLLERFIEYFDEKSRDLIDTTDHKKLASFNQLFNFDKLSEEKVLNEKIENFLQATYMPKIFSKNKNGFVHLTKRETECLHYLSQGKTMKEIGRTLSLSPKTIEFYLSNIKEKSGYISKSELLSQYSKNHLIYSKYL